MRKISKIFVSILLLTILLITNTLGAAALQSFTDVAENHWAKGYIEKMSEKKIITGYPDATFRPSQNVDKMSAIVMIFRTLKATDKLVGVDINSLVNKHNMTLAEHKIPGWAREAVATALEKNIINQSELKTFFEGDGSLSKASRIEISVFLGKALNTYLKKELHNNVITLHFRDSEFISQQAFPYVDLLVQKNIIKGDDQGNFNPNDPIVRAAAAKMFAGFYDTLGGIVSDPVNVEPEESKELKTKEGKIVQVSPDSNQIVVTDDKGEISLYKLEDNTKIIIQDEISNLRYLQKGEDITLYTDEYDRLAKIESNADNTSFEATISDIRNMGSYHLVTVEEDDSNRKINYKADEDTFILLNDKEADIDELRDGDRVSLSISGGKIEEIIAESRTRIYEGILESNVVFNQHPELVIKTYTQKVYELEIDEDVRVEKNDRRKKLTDLYKGDIVIVTTKNGKVTKIEATSVEVKSEDEGVITQIILGSYENKITILNEDGDTKTYVISPDVDIEIDDKDSSIDELKVDYEVEFKMENDMVIDIEAEEVETSDSIKGIITEIFDDYDAITVKVKDGRETKYISVLADDAEIISTNGRKRSFSRLDEDDEVFISGNREHKIFNFVADKIIILKEN